MTSPIDIETPDHHGHTALPWRVQTDRNVIQIVDAHNFLISHVYDGGEGNGGVNVWAKSLANAGLIVRACNEAEARNNGAQTAHAAMQRERDQARLDLNQAQAELKLFQQHVQNRATERDEYKRAWELQTAEVERVSKLRDAALDERDRARGQHFVSRAPLETAEQSVVIAELRESRDRLLMQFTEAAGNRDYWKNCATEMGQQLNELTTSRKYATKDEMKELAELVAKTTDHFNKTLREVINPLVDEHNKLTRLVNR